MITMVVHGGAGHWREEQRARARQGIQAAVDAGHAILRQGGSALDAVQRAVVILEDDPVFNAGRGAVSDELGNVSHDASIMRGSDRAAGAVAAVTGMRNPIQAARAVLDEGRHVLLVGLQGSDTASDATGGGGNTVGAVARDLHGHLAAATSTGGISGKHPARVGDSALIGAGTWASDTVAVSCTGDGEGIIRVALAHEIDALVRHAHLPLDHAADRALHQLAPFGTGGLIALGADGAPATPFTTRAMPRAVRIGDHPARIDV
ncbi:isoaspartyl peptidase/L-asparaginase [Solirubrobacter sp. CPCC 204708]|uniref:Isoaspartyl peptidase/L-asparaginase n=1 Tax=Solirubrobacter deserti TaxID=2282478 RepID=A0ABT4RH23_9ACTN|nr:isoaspartyl peptidase/L-asparaginase [Solirubrobacter deserti]MBE2315466.1 isoaspartyl peptidase/L-asparaginase [Solirubrobacter deserti]MDA0137691.1 isoaspartyl peptidase/L-asparaginase [Solirubrobacter deserti]